MESCTGYLFVHFTGEEKLGEQIYFALSRDGLHWMDLNNGNPVLLSDIGEKGVRDPFILRNPRPERAGRRQRKPAAGISSYGSRRI